jgi:hypothetical protein
MAKDESYSKPGHVPGVALFFKQDKEDHSKRKRIWANAFTRSSYARSFRKWDQEFIITRVNNFFPPLERRTTQLVNCISHRTGSEGVVDLGVCIQHWSYDFMVRFPSFSGFCVY